MEEHSATHLTENQVIDFMIKHLESIGWKVNPNEVKRNREPGIDIRATKGKVELLIEAKGAIANDHLTNPEREPFKKSTQLDTHFAMAIYQSIKMRINNPKAEVAIALPYTANMEHVVGKTPVALKKLDIKIFWVNLDGSVAEQ